MYGKLLYLFIFSSFLKTFESFLYINDINVFSLNELGKMRLKNVNHCFLQSDEPDRLCLKNAFNHSFNLYVRTCT